VKAHALQATHSKRGEPVVVLQATELALHGRTAPVEVTESLRVAWDAREQPTAESERQGWLVGLLDGHYGRRPRYR
jgi:hypothetical protein